MPHMSKRDMRYNELVEFIETKMRMQHIYLPLLIKTLVECGGTATVRQLAQVVLAHDESQVKYYEDRLKNMPIPVLKRHGVVEKEKDLVSLLAKKMSLEERSEILMLCERKLREFVAEHGLDVWDHRMLADPVGGSVWYEVQKRDKWQCQSCGVKKSDPAFDERGPFHVDHIKPRSKGGSSELDNLQLLCARCNMSKGNRDDTDLR